MSKSAVKSKPGPKRGGKTAKLKSISQAVELDGKGLSQREIALQLGVSQPQICYDLKEAKKKFLATINAEMAAKVAVKLQQYEDAIVRAFRIMDAAWAAFERSKIKRVKTTAADGSTSWEEQEVPGNPMFLTELRGAEELVHKTLKAERELLDLDGSALPEGQERSTQWPLAELFRRADEYRAETARMIEAKVTTPPTKEGGDDAQG